MNELERLLTEINETEVVTLNGAKYAVKNCVVAADNDIIRLTACVADSLGKLVEVSVESGNSFRNSSRQ